MKSAISVGYFFDELSTLYDERIEKEEVNKLKEERERSKTKVLYYMHVFTKQFKCTEKVVNKGYPKGVSVSTDSTFEDFLKKIPEIEDRFNKFPRIVYSVRRDKLWIADGRTKEGIIQIKDDMMPIKLYDFEKHGRCSVDEFLYLIEVNTIRNNLVIREGLGGRSRYAYKIANVEDLKSGMSPILYLCSLKRCLKHLGRTVV